MRNRSSSRGAKEEVKIVKASIPKALREQVWLTYAGRVYERRCLIPWCQNTMSVFDFHVGHDIPESQGGATEIANLRPICSRCNLSMSSNYTVQEWSRLSRPIRPWYIRMFCCFHVQSLLT
jgi:5-methylcytosine-specific restriction endonuclease McrA